MLLQVEFGTGVEKLEQVLVHRLLRRRVVRHLLVLILIEVLRVSGYILDLHGRLVSRPHQVLSQLRVLSLKSAPCHHRLSS